MIIVFLSLVGLLALVLALALMYRALLQHRAARVLTIHSTSGIDEGRFVHIGGCEQWVQIRGADRTNPILLIVHGHGLSMGAFTPLLRAFEQHFTVVQWDRRGVGKTGSRSGKADSQTWTLDLLADDGLAVTEFLCRRLQQDKVILLGHSQGSAIGLLMVRRRPERFHAYVGTGQITEMLRNEIITYATAVERARTAHHTRALKMLEGIGAPPYPAVQTWLIKQRWGVSTSPEMAAWRSLFLPLVLTAPTYSLREVYHAFTDVLFLPQLLYEELLAFDAQRLFTTFAVPCFIFQGDSDVFSPPALAQQYIATVAAPTKGLVLLKGGGHLALLLQPEQFLQELLTHVRPLVIPQTSTTPLDAGGADESPLPDAGLESPVLALCALPERGGEAR